MTFFAGACTAGAAAQDAIFGETVRWAPQASGEESEYVSAGADPVRPERTLVGIFDEEAVISRVVGSGANSHDNADVVAGKSQIDFDASLFADLPGLPIQGDRLVLTDRPGSPCYRIVSVQPDDTCRVVCLLTALGAAT